MIRTHNLLDTEVTLEAGHRAWAAYEAQAGRSVLVATNLHALWGAGISMVYEFGWGLSAKWRASHAPALSYENWLDALPPIGSDSWNELHAKISDLVCLTFYGKDWAEMLALLESTARAMKAAE
ncbi:MAG: hypothetical protein ACH37Z_15100 [Anaerolineae bacterium]